MISTRTREVRTRTAIRAAVAIFLSLALTAVMPAQSAFAFPPDVKPVSVGQPPTNPPTKPRPYKPRPNKPRPQKPLPPANTPGGGGGGGGGPAYCDDTGAAMLGCNMESWQNWSSARTYWFPDQRPPRELVAQGSSDRRGIRPVYGGTCDAWSADGGDARKGGLKYQGVRTNQSGQLLIVNGRVQYSRQDSASYTCIDRPTFTENPRDCAATVGATATGPYDNPDVPKTTYFTSGRKNSAFANSGYKNLSLCDKAYTQTFAATRTELGRYKLVGTGTQVTCTIRQYTSKNARTGATPPDEIVDCTNERAYMKDEARWQVWCSGWSMGWAGKHSFTPDECRQTLDWSCGPNYNKVPKFGSVSVPAAGIGVMDDGKKRAATWLVPNPTGTGLKPGSVGSKQVTLELNTSSTPYKKTEDVNGEKQPFLVDPKLNSPLPWSNKTWNIGFQAPSLPPSSDGKKSNMWVATPTWSFVAEFKTITFTNVTVDWRTGGVTPTVVPKWVKDSATCPGLPLSLAVNRARNVR